MSSKEAEALKSWSFSYPQTAVSFFRTGTRRTQLLACPRIVSQARNSRNLQAARETSRLSRLTAGEEHVPGRVAGTSSKSLKNSSWHQVWHNCGPNSSGGDFPHLTHPPSITHTDSFSSSLNKIEPLLCVEPLLGTRTFWIYHIKQTKIPAVKKLLF